MNNKCGTIPLVLFWSAVLTTALSASALADRPADTASAGIPPVTAPQYPKGGWGIDILISTDGFGLGTYYRREFTPDIAGVLSLSVSESKDPREVEQIDPFTGTSYTPGKLNRFMVIPLMAGVQYRLFREDIMDSFRPYVNAAVGPTMIYVMPYVDLVTDSTGIVSTNQVEFFSAIGRGHPEYTIGGYVGFGANFGSETAGAFGVNLRYYFTYLFSDGIPSLYNTTSGQVASTKSSFGGFFITLNLSLGG